MGRYRYSIVGQDGRFFDANGLLALERRKLDSETSQSLGWAFWLMIRHWAHASNEIEDARAIGTGDDGTRERMITNTNTDGSCVNSCRKISQLYFVLSFLCNIEKALLIIATICQAMTYLDFDCKRTHNFCFG